MYFQTSIFLYVVFPLILFLQTFVNVKGKNILLLISSLLLYFWSEQWQIAYLIATICLSYAVGHLLVKCDDRYKKVIFIVGIVGNLVILSTGKFLQKILVSFGHGPYDFLHYPIGVSFFTFQSMSYIIDLYYHRIEREKSLIDFACYVSMFPQLAAGPIVRMSEVMGQLKKRILTFEETREGIKRFIVGLAKKVLVADTFAKMVDQIWEVPIGGETFLLAWVGMIGFVLQLYFDFSGYSDMAIGLGKMLGFQLPENFNKPYISKSFVEFWRRWHITLGTWFRDYVYIPLGGNREGVWKTYRNVFLVFILTAIWHGVGANFLIWGGLNGLFMLLTVFNEKKEFIKLPDIVRIAMTFTLFVLVMGIFRSTQVEKGFAMIQAALFLKDAVIPGYDYYMFADHFLLGLGVFALIISFDGRNFLYREVMKNRLSSYLILIGMFVLTLWKVSYETYEPFVYFQF